jgi:WD40 repeat protein
MWDVGAGKPIGAPLSTSGCGSVNGVAFAPDGATLAVACEAEGTDLWDVASRKRVGAPLLTTGCDSVYTVAFAPGGGTLAVGCIEKTVLWDVTAESTLGGPITSPDCTSVSSVAFSAREGTLAVGCDSGNTVLGRSVAWSSSNELQSQVCQLVWGDLTPDEWRILAPGLPYQAAC